MKTYYTWTGGLALVGAFFNAIGTFLLVTTIREMMQVPTLTPPDLTFYLGGIAFVVAVITCFDFWWLTRRHFKLVLTSEGVLVIRAVLRVTALIPISEITRITAPTDPFVRMSLTNWEETGGTFLIQHGSSETTIDRFPDEEDLLTELVTRNPAVKVVRTTTT